MDHQRGCDSLEQPFSIVTTETTLDPRENGSEELLTMQILEASKRKMRLLEELLTPDEFQSLPPGMIHERNSFIMDIKRNMQDLQQVSTTENTSKSMPAQSENNREMTINRNELRLADRKGLSKSFNNLHTIKYEHRQQSQTPESDDFFHSQPNNTQPSISQRVPEFSFESGTRYIDTTREPGLDLFYEHTKPVWPYRIFENLFSLIGFFVTTNDDSDGQNSATPITRESQEFVSHFQAMRGSHPYNSESSLMCIWNRLSRSGDLSRLQMEPIDESKERSINNRNIIIVVSCGQRAKPTKSIECKASCKLEIGNSCNLSLMKEIDLAKIPLVEWFIWSSSRDHVAISDLQDADRRENAGHLKIQLMKMRLTKHPLLATEEILAIQLVRLFESYEKLLIRFETSLFHILQVMESVKSQDLMLFELLDVFSALLEEIRQVESNLVKNYEDIAAQRNLQGYSLSDIKMISRSPPEKVTKLEQEFRILNQKLLDYQNFTDKKPVMNLGPPPIRLNLEQAPESFSNDWAKEERDRRLQITSWFESLRLRLWIGERFYHDCHYDDSKPSNEMIWTHGLMANNNIKIPILDEELKGVTLRLDLLEPKLMVFSWPKNLIASEAVELSWSGGKISSGNKSFRLKVGEEFFIEIPFDWAFEVPVERSACSSQNTRFSDFQSKMIDELYKKTLKVDLVDNLNLERKLARVLNLVEPNCVLHLIGLNSTKERQHSTPFSLDPFEDKWCPDSMSSIRHKLLLWRWFNNLNQPVHLSRAENLKRYASQLEGWKETDIAQLMILETPLLDYRLIEQHRLRAAKLICYYEQHLRNLLDFNARKFNKPIDRLEELLREPQIKRLNWNRLIRVMRLLVPRHQARRPLMPKRRRWPAQIQQNSILTSESHLDLNPHGGDTEALANWQKQSLNPVAKFAGLQLVVTIQQATNVPMRLQISNDGIRSDIQSGTRSVSPFLGSQTANSPHGSTSGNSNQRRALIGDISSMGTRLIPPTTYVEVVFQRRQQATSLTPGRDPVWNETIFFPVETQPDPQEQSQSESQTHSELTKPTASQFVDEFLQLNLFDYNCYPVQESNLTDSPAPSTLAPPLPSQAPSWATTMTMDSLNEPGSMNLANEQHLASIQSTHQQQSALGTSLMSASHQRIERHLLGNLQIPLSTLLTNNKIEGSFSLNQPLFLDNYQFLTPNSRDLVSMNNATLQFQQQRNSININQRPNENFNFDTRHSPHAPETRISVFISLDPPISMATIVHLPLESHEIDHIYQYSRLWEQVLSKQRYYAIQHHSNNNNNFSNGSSQDNDWNRTTITTTATSANLETSTTSWRRAARHMRYRQNRYVRALILYKNAKYCLICRLLGPMYPPESLVCQDETRTIFRLARFVSLLSPIKTGLFNLRFLDKKVWFDSKQLLEQNLGGSEEKAVLLCNYLLQMGKCSSLLLGQSISDGPCVHVIVWNEQTKCELENTFQLVSSSEENLPSEQKLINNPTSIESLEVNNLLLQDGTTNNLEQKIKSPTTIISSSSYNKQPVDNTNFLNQLPVLISGRFIQIWDPKDAKCFSLNEHSSLLSVGSIVTPENVYANIQFHDSPSETNFDIRSRTNWFPLFDNKTASQATLRSTLSGQFSFGSSQANRGAIGNHSSLLSDYYQFRGQNSWKRQLAQLESLGRSIGKPILESIVDPFNGLSMISYQTFGEDQCTQLRSFLEKAIKTNLLKWRQDRPTYFNRTLSRKLTQKLALMEDFLVSSSGSNTTKVTGTNSFIVNTTSPQPATPVRDWRVELADHIRNAILMPHVTSGGNTTTRQVISWTINIPFTGVKTILDSLFASDVHNADLLLDCYHPDYELTSSNTQFLVASHAHPYPAHTISIWLYVAALVPTTKIQQRF